MSITVLDDTEIGQEEWQITTSVRVPGGKLKKVAVEADVGDGEVFINEALGSKTYPKSIFPLDHPGGIVVVRELDVRVDEEGSGRLGEFLSLPCPSGIEDTEIVVGRGHDLSVPGFPTFEVFTVKLRYRWDVTELPAGEAASGRGDPSADGPLTVVPIAFMGIVPAWGAVLWVVKRRSRTDRR